MGLGSRVRCSGHRAGLPSLDGKVMRRRFEAVDEVEAGVRDGEDNMRWGPEVLLVETKVRSRGKGRGLGSFIEDKDGRLLRPSSDGLARELARYWPET